jgi:hypothetical protein
VGKYRTRSGESEELRRTAKQLISDSEELVARAKALTKRLAVARKRTKEGRRK